MKQITPVSLVALIVTFAAQIAWASGHSSGGTVHVHSYYRKDGTYVHAYDRIAPGTASYSAATSGTGTTKSSAAYGPTTSSTSASNAAITAAVAVPAATPDLRSSTQTVQDAIAAGRIIVKHTKPAVTSTTTSVSPSGVVRDSNGKIKRSESAKHEFMRMTRYPNGREGYVVDHIVPLKRGGCDCPSNMQWQTIQEAKAKDKWE